MFILVRGESTLKEAWKNRKRQEMAALSGEMGSYGSGMLLYAVSSWINNAIDRYFILFMLSPAENGLYGIAYKIPAILTTFQRIFAQSWQMSAVKEYKGADREGFFSNMYGIYEAVLVLSCAGIIWLLKPISAILFRKDFFVAWMLTPPLLISVVFGALEGFLGSICLAFKDGAGMGKATGTGAIVNIILNSLLIPLMGSFGAALATLCSYFVMFFLAFRFVLSHVALKTRHIRDGLSYMLLILESALVIGSVWLYPLWNGIICLILFIMYFEELKMVLKKFTAGRKSCAL